MKILLRFGNNCIRPRQLSLKTGTKALPRPKGLPMIGTMLDLILAGGGPKLHLYIDSRHKQLGPIFTETLGTMNAIFISDPRDMRRVFSEEGKYPVHLLPEAWVLYNKLYGRKRGLFFMDGEEWLYYRHVMNKIMIKTEPSGGLIDAYKSATVDLVIEWSQNIEKPIDNVVHHMYNLSISYVIATLLGSSYFNHKNMLRDDIKQLSSIVHLIFEESTKLNFLPAKMAALLQLPVWRRFVSSVNITLNTGNQLVNELLPIAAHDGLLHQMSSEGIDHDNIVNIVVDLILAGADTTPYTMIWALYLLARNPEVQANVARALEEAPPGERAHHPLLKAVMRETLRLYPAAPFLTRQLANDSQLGGYTVPGGEMIIMSLYTSGRCEAYFPEPLQFQPERWMRVDGRYQGVTDATASLPFAMGGRACVGRRVAESLFTTTLAELLSQFHVEVKKDIDMVLMLVPVPAEPVSLHLKTRRTTNTTI